MSNYSQATALLYEGTEVRGLDFYKPLSIPYYCTTAFKATTLEEMQQIAATKFSYVRFSNPNREALAKVVSYLEQGEKSLIFSAGMGAITTTLMTLLRPGDEVLCSRAIYGETFQVMTDILPAFGIHVVFADFRNTENAEKAVTDKTKMIYTEVCSNPVLRMADIPALAQLAHAHGALLMVDNTFTTNIAIKPITLGADIVINSLTKFMNGHSDAIGGSITASAEIIQKLEYFRPLYGTAGDPYASFTMYKNFGTMDLRVRRQMSNAAALAAFLEKDPHVRVVNHPSLKSHPQHALAMRLFPNEQTMSGMLSFALDEDIALLNKFTSHLKFVHFASTLGGIHTTLMHPCTSSHADVPDADRRDMGITPGLLRVSVGIEDPQDLIEEFRQALAALD